MGGFTTLKLRDTSQENIEEHNQHLDELGVAKRYRFYSLNDIKYQYEAFVNGKGVFKECFFPPDKINSFEDFLKYWSPRALGECFVPYMGSLNFDSYFGRTSKRAMHGLARYLLIYGDHIRTTSGSYSTFVERCGYKAKTKQRQLMLLD
jgi:hypothetical protein